MAFLASGLVACTSSWTPPGDTGRERPAGSILELHKHNSDLQRGAWQPWSHAECSDANLCLVSVLVRGTRNWYHVRAPHDLPCREHLSLAFARHLNGSATPLPGYSSTHDNHVHLEMTGCSGVVLVPSTLRHPAITEFTEFLEATERLNHTRCLTDRDATRCGIRVERADLGLESRKIWVRPPRDGEPGPTLGYQVEPDLLVAVSPMPLQRGLSRRASATSCTVATSTNPPLHGLQVRQDDRDARSSRSQPPDLGQAPRPSARELSWAEPHARRIRPCPPGPSPRMSPSAWRHPVPCPHPSRALASWYSRTMSSTIRSIGSTSSMRVTP